MEKDLLIDDTSDILKQLLAEMGAKSAMTLGYPVAKDIDFSELLPFIKYPLNNVGDPFIPSTYTVGSREQEKEVIEFFSKLFRAEEDNWWGYVTNGGSEGNLYGLYLARELYPKAIVYYSEATHYSVQKNLHLLNMPNITIRSQDSGEIDYDDLEKTISINRQMPVIILANIGTTMTEARDDVGKMKAIFKRLAIQHHYIHVDGALAGSYAAFMEPRPAFDFADGADSIAISGHKFFGSLIPCGMVIAKKNHRDRIARSIDYIGTMDTTISGSRNGHTPLFLWYVIKKLGVEGLRKRTRKSLEVAAYAEEMLREVEPAVWRNPSALTVNIPKPDKALIKKWQLASGSDWAHIICMPGIDKEQIDAFVSDFKLSKLSSAVLAG
ncbi:histidine decarboxylase [Mucilaginibacter gotjawali]|uniref:Histidine decarboxylase n=1 Tax=Mucilaginibacter gotjawali TaxID=1550579 RepID=A0A839SHM1_9SPHI|nr:histidine decarboxylase [Mucilaginibacter gotjawali]MBB3056784.1 histidine decarboxylase [Mucilaginibacter gotjawali]